MKRRRNALYGWGSDEWGPLRIGSLVAGGALFSVGLYQEAHNILPCFSFTSEANMTPEERAKCDAEKSAAATAQTLEWIGGTVFSAALFGPGLIKFFTGRK